MSTILVTGQIQTFCSDFKATGVEYVDESTSQRTTAKASRLVVLSGGAFGSPTILQRQESLQYNMTNIDEFE